MDTLLVRDPRTRVVEHQQKEHIVIQGASRVTEYTQVSNSYSQNEASWSFQPPSTKTMVDRNIKQRIYVRVSPLGGGVFQFGTNDALRQAPIASITETIDCKLNGGSLSDSLANRIHAMLTFNNTAQDRTARWSTSPMMPDAYIDLNDWTLYGSSKCPLKEYGETSIEDTRGGFPYTVSPAPAPAGSYDFILTEPLFLPPFNASPTKDDEAFININTIDLKLRWVSDLGRILTHASSGDPLLTGVSVSFYRAPELLVRYLTPDQNQALPNLQVLPYMVYNDFPRTVTLQPAGGVGASQTVVSDTLKLNQIPRKLMLFARRSRNTTTFETADAWANISGVSLLWNNENNLLSSATEQDLFQITQSNGSNLSWSQWHKYRGSVFMGQFGTDIGLIQGLSPGVMGQFTLSATAVLNNLATTAVEYELFLTVMVEGSIEITENALATNLGNLTVDVVEQAEFGPEVAHADAVSAQGGSFFTDMKHFANKLSRGVQKVAGFAGKVAPAISAFNPEIGAIVGAGAGAAGRLAGQVRGATGGGLSGGAMGRRRLGRMGRY